MSKKILDLKTVSWSGEDQFNEDVKRLLHEGYVPYTDVIITFSPTTTSPGLTPGFDRIHSGSRYLTQQFAKYEEEIDLVSTLRECVSETWGAKSFGEAQKLFDNFLETRNIKL